MLDLVVGLGSNLGDRRQILTGAHAALAARFRVVAASGLYESAAVGPAPQGRYLNAALRLRAEGPPDGILAELLAIERGFGRERRVRWGPRTLDLDILWIEGVVHDSPRLTVPHPRLGERAFAMVPLLEVAPAARDPRTGRRYGDRPPCPGALDLIAVAGHEWAPVQGLP